MEHKVRDALLTLDGDLAGTYRSLVDMSKEEKAALIEEHLLYNDGEDRFLNSAGGYNDWPVSYISIKFYSLEDNILIFNFKKDW